MKYTTADDIPQKVVDQIKTKKTYISLAERLARKRGVTIDALSDDDWRQIYYDKAKRRSDYYRRSKLKSIAEDVPELPDRTPATLEEYLAYYENPAPNDITTIEQLVSFQRQLAVVERLIEETLSADSVDTRRYKDLVDIQKQLSLETRQLQDTLGISRKQRERMRTEQRLSDHLQKNIRQARELIEEYGIKIICPSCEARGVRILQGFVVNHFPEMGIEVRTRCPACQQEFTITRAPTKWIRKVEPDAS